MVFGLLSTNPGISVPKAYVQGLAGEWLALSLGAGLTLLVHGSVPWPEIALLALPLGIIIPCLKRGTPWNRIPLVFWFSLFVALALS